MRRKWTGFSLLGMGILLTSLVGPDLHGSLIQKSEVGEEHQSKRSTQPQEKSAITETLTSDSFIVESAESSTEETEGSVIESDTSNESTIEQSSVESESESELSSTSTSSSDFMEVDSETQVSKEEEQISSKQETVSSTDSIGEGGSQDDLQDSTETEIEKVPETLPSVRPTVPLPPISSYIPQGNMYLSSDFKGTEIAKDDLHGFELPLLSSYSKVAQGAIVYEGIKSLNRSEEELNSQVLIEEIYQGLFEKNIFEDPLEDITNTELLPGDVVYFNEEEEKQLLGLYLGRDFYLSVVEKEEEKEIKMVPQIARTYFQEKEKIQVQRINQEKLTAYGQEVLADYPASFDFQPNFMTERLIESIGEEARTLGLEYDVFASVMIAQAILESGGGTSQLSNSPYHNLFGVKGSYQGQSVTFSTKEDRGNGELYEIQSAFRAYPNYQASLSDYVQLLRGGISNNPSFYEKAWRSKAKNYLGATYELRGKYATDTSYHNKLNSIIAAYHLTTYDKQKIAETGVFIEGFERIPEAYREHMQYPKYDGKNYNTSGSYPIGECTWYAFNRVSQLGMSVDDFMGNGGEWGETGKRLGYQVLDRPRSGTLISFVPGTAGSDPRYGHVAFVEAVGPEGILISEGNVYGGTTISYRVISNELAYSDFVSYIVPKR